MLIFQTTRKDKGVIGTVNDAKKYFWFLTEGFLNTSQKKSKEQRKGFSFHVPSDFLKAIQEHFPLFSLHFANRISASNLHIVIQTAWLVKI